MPPTFADTFCARYQLTAAEFERAVLRRILYPHARFLAPLVRLTEPEYFAEDLDLIRSVGQIRHLRQFHDACTDYRHHLAHTSAARRFLRLRASARKLYHLVAETLPAPASPPSTHHSAASPHSQVPT